MKPPFDWHAAALDLPSADAVSEVDAGNNGALQAEIAGLADGAAHAIVLSDGGGLHTVTIDGGKTIAIVSDSDDVQSVRGNDGSPVITVTGAGSTVYLHRLRFEDTDDVGVSVGPAATLYADNTQVVGNDGGGVNLTTGSSGFLRNCMVGGSSVDVAAVLVSGGSLDALYTSFLGGALDSYGRRCTSGSATVRNSIITTRGDNDALVCPGASVSNSSVEDTGNPDWFVDYNGGNAHLTPNGQTVFANVAVWEQGDPPFDYADDTRPNADGAADYAGAGTVP